MKEERRARDSVNDTNHSAMEATYNSKGIVLALIVGGDPRTSYGHYLCWQQSLLFSYSNFPLVTVVLTFFHILNYPWITIHAYMICYFSPYSNSPVSTFFHILTYPESTFFYILIHPELTFFLYSNSPWVNFFPYSNLPWVTILINN